MAGRLGLSDLAPSVACGRSPAKAVVGEIINVSATVFREGNDAVAANVLWQPPGVGGPANGRHGGARDDNSRAEPLILMKREANWSSRFETTVIPDRQGLWTLAVQAWSDPLAGWRHTVEVKPAAGRSTAEMANDLESGALLMERVAARPEQRYAGAVRIAIEAPRDATRSVAERGGPALAAELWPVLTADPLRELITTSEPVTVWVDRKLAQFGSWYEFFPRSCGAQVDPAGRPLRHGTPADATAQLDRAAAMGFDIVYLPPIHPIGERNRKGRNNSVHAEPGDVGSPWAIGSAAGGHTAVHPELGTLADFDAFVAAAAGRGLQVALDLALQCSPDHPWVIQHPEWFTTQPDGSIAHAENPPKKYQDIYPLNFDNDPAGLYAEVLRVVQFWIDRGVLIFRVDNPHTKPIDLWEWLIWRTRKTELAEYGAELVASADYLRPNFFVNTPDILHASLQDGGPGMFAIRAVLAATLSPSWGVYSGFELYENQAVAPGSEEYLDSEKHQLSLWFHGISNDNLLCYSRRSGVRPICGCPRSVWTPVTSSMSSTSCPARSTGGAAGTRSGWTRTGARRTS